MRVLEVPAVGVDIAPSDAIRKRSVPAVEKPIVFAVGLNKPVSPSSPG